MICFACPHPRASNADRIDGVTNTDTFDRWLHQAGRAVSPDQRKTVEQRLASPVCRQPIYLKLLFKEARLWRSYDSAPQLGRDDAALLEQLIDRLSLPANHTELLVERVSGYLTASRYGLAETEILEILFADPEYKKELDNASLTNRHELPPNATRIPIAIWSRLRFDLAPYLTERAAPGANVLTFYHRQVAEWVQEHLAKAPDPTWQAHPRLAKYFTECARGTAPQREWETESVRGFAESVHHHACAKEWYDVERTLTDFGFLMQKTRLGLLEGLLDDWTIIDSQAPENTKLQLGVSRAFFREKAHVLRRGNDEWPAHKILLQLAVEDADDSPLTIGAEKWLAKVRCDWLWLRRSQRQSHAHANPFMVSVLEGHTGSVKGALALPRKRLVSWSNDQTLRLWDTQSGRCLTVLSGQTAYVVGVLVLPSGLLLSWSGDKTLRIWDCEKGNCLAILDGHDDCLRGALILHGGDILSWSQDKTLRRWDGSRYVCLTVFRGHTAGVHGVVELPEHRLLSWAWDGTLRFWDLRSGNCVEQLTGTTSFDVRGAMELSDGRILSWSGWSKVLQVWNDHAGTPQVILRGHSAQVVGACELSNGKVLTWGRDCTLRVWDSGSGMCLAILQGHTDAVEGAIVLRDRCILSWSADTSLRIWDAGTFVCLTTFQGHTGIVTGGLELPDGSLLSWSNDHELRVWDRGNFKCLSILGGHTGSINGGSALGIGGVVSWAADGTLRLWETRSTASQTQSDGALPIEDAVVISNNRVLSWDVSNLQLWDAQSGSRLARYDGQLYLKGVLELSDGHLLSWSWDGTLRVWDADQLSICSTFTWHDWLCAGARVLELSNGTLLSWGDNKELRISDQETGQCIMTLTGHTDTVEGALELSHGNLVSWSDDRTLRLWNAQSGVCVAVLAGHTNVINCALELNDGRLLSWSMDKTLRLWDGQTGTCQAVLEGHKSAVWGALEVIDGQLLSWSSDKTLRLWDAQSGSCLEVVPDGQVVRLHPDWLHLRARAETPGNVCLDHFLATSPRTAHLRHCQRTVKRDRVGSKVVPFE